MCMLLLFAKQKCLILTLNTMFLVRGDEMNFDKKLIQPAIKLTNKK